MKLKKSLFDKRFFRYLHTQTDICYVVIGELYQGDIVRLFYMRKELVKYIEFEYLDEHVKVYNIEENFHIYYISETWSFDT